MWKVALNRKLTYEIIVALTEILEKHKFNETNPIIFALISHPFIHYVQRNLALVIDSMCISYENHHYYSNLEICPLTLIA